MLRDSRWSNLRDRESSPGAVERRPVSVAGRGQPSCSQPPFLGLHRRSREEQLPPECPQIGSWL